jgi:hypothetical protein
MDDRFDFFDRRGTVPAILLTFLLMHLSGQAAAAQASASTRPVEGARKLAYVVPSLLEDAILSLDPLFQHILRQSIIPNMASVNSALATQLSNLPMPSPASGYRYVFDPGLGVYVRMVQSLGPFSPSGRKHWGVSDSSWRSHTSAIPSIGLTTWICAALPLRFRSSSRSDRGNACPCW